MLTFSACAQVEPDVRIAHRRVAERRAGRCFTCLDGRTKGQRIGGAEPCFGGCGAVVDYYSCSPGYCVLCAHDPCWVCIA